MVECEDMDEEEIPILIRELQQFDNPKGYRLEYETVKKKLEPVVSQIALKGEEFLDYLHDLIKYEESWSCVFALEVLQQIKSEKSIPNLIEFIRNNEDGDYWEGCETALYALKAIGKPAIPALLDEVSRAFEKEKFYSFLVGSLTGIKDKEVYSFMITILGDYLKNHEKYQDWFEIASFTYEFTEQDNKAALPLLKDVMASNIISEEEKRELRDTIKKLEDPEGFKKETDEIIKDMGMVKLGRNDLCHCGSEIKYKKCCLEKDIKETGKPRKVLSGRSADEKDI